jgi:multiple antibiotic resistance protein
MDGFVLSRMVGDFIFGFGTLFAIINPYGLAFVFLDRTMGLSEAERRRIAKRIAINALIVLLVSLFAGSAILRFFGISLPALRIAGGLVVAHAGWTMLNEVPNDGGRSSRATGNYESVRRAAFFPLTIPLTTGPGTIAAAIALGAGRSSEVESFLLSSVVSLFVAVAIALTILNAYGGASFLARVVGAEGTRVVTRLSAFLLLCVAVEIMLIGTTDALRPLLALRQGG